MYENNPSGWMWLMMAAVMLGFWTLVFLAVGSLWPTSHRARSTYPNTPPQDVLDARLAHGEISLAEHRELTEHLTNKQGQRT